MPSSIRQTTETSSFLSSRDQNWIVKINYANGTADGKILWHLGPDGDFNLPLVRPPRWRGTTASTTPFFLVPTQQASFPGSSLTTATTAWMQATTLRDGRRTALLQQCPTLSTE